MTIHPDFKELLRLLEEHRVDYMIVGGYAVAYHGYPRFTKDLDIFFDASDDNIGRLRAALMAFAFDEESLPVDVFKAMGNVLTFGAEPSRVDLLNSIDGITYQEARPSIVRGSYDDLAVSFIGLDALLQNKRATERTRDKADLEELGGSVE
ncbi:MAG: hypothetical protein ACOCX4_07050 [Planctomycetota bacterium]